MYNKIFVPFLKGAQTNLKYYYQQINIYLEFILTTVFFSLN